jgi:hypothetical protein
MTNEMVTTTLPYRLQRTSAFGGELPFRVLLTLGWSGFFGWFIYMSWTHGPSATPAFIWAILVFFALFGLGMVWDVVVRIGRTSMGRVPTVEVDRQPARLGETLTVRVCLARPGTLSSLEALVAGITVTTSGPTTATQDGFQQSIMSAAQAELAALSLFDRTTSFRLPAAEEVAENTARWEIRVGTVLRQGGLLISTFPIDIRR